MWQRPALDNYVSTWRGLDRGIAKALSALLTMLLLAQIGQPFPETAWLHHAPTLILIAALPPLLRRWPLSQSAVICVILFFALHTLGGRYTYSSVPYDDWFRSLFGSSLNEAIGWQRNHYDRLVHFAFGALFYAPLRECELRLGGASRGFAAIHAIAFVVAAGALYEIFEWALTAMVAPELADDYNGQQGDMWDAQKDMALAMLGAMLAAGIVKLKERRE